MVSSPAPKKGKKHRHEGAHSIFMLCVVPVGSHTTLIFMRRGGVIGCLRCCPTFVSASCFLIRIVMYSSYAISAPGAISSIGQIWYSISHSAFTRMLHSTVNIQGREGSSGDVCTNASISPLPVHEWHSYINFWHNWLKKALNFISQKYISSTTYADWGSNARSI